MKIICTYFLVTLWCGSSFGQQRQCGTQDPPVNHLESEYVDLSLHSRSDFLLPIVFHILTDSRSMTITREQVLDQLHILNNAFSGQRTNENGVPANFLAIEGRPNVRFCLANIDPMGQPSEGITHIETSLENIADLIVSDGKRRVHHSSLGGQSAWNSDQYINIWVADSDRFAGKSTFPDEELINGEEGIIIDPDFFGSSTTGNINFPFHLGKTLVHEMGHYFNLPHIWGSGIGGNCDIDDGLADTPLQQSPYTGCPELEQSSCGSQDMFYNYMDFTDDRCLSLFTMDQSNAMVQSLLSSRSSLIANNNCTMVNQGGPTVVSTHHIPYTNYIEVDYESGDGEVVEYILFGINGSRIMEIKSTIFDKEFLPIPTVVSGVYILYAITEDQVFQEKILIVN